MPSSPSSDRPDDRFASFACRWRVEGPAAASVRVSGELDMATAGQFERVFREALSHARLVLVDMHEVSFMDSSGLHTIIDAASSAAAQGGRVVLSGASAEVEALLDVTGTRAHLNVLSRAPHTDEDASGWRRSEEPSIRPLDNPVNARVVRARVMAILESRLWIQAADGVILRPWSPASARLPVPPSGTQIEVYLDASGAVNGWREPESGLAINQRGVGPDEAPRTYADLACQGPCGVVWRAPAGRRLAERAEHCLTCAGPLALG